uniref:Eukaryotic translation initiation factor 5 n=1 Tax=Peromyscus maniculatus bairdii TaxID=230844 RepID=A0A8C8W4W7_PERMB
MSVNVNRSVSDQFYHRYKMPRLIAKVEGKGHGIKTVIVNMVDVAKALNRPPKTCQRDSCQSRTIY